MVCIIYECNFCSCLSFLISFRIGSIAVLILIIFMLHTSHVLYLLYILLFVFSSVDASQESCLGTVVNMITQCQMFPINNDNKFGMHDSPKYSKRMESVSLLSFVNIFNQ